jgi:1,4-alpha-glucan branching enzyme
MVESQRRFHIPDFLLVADSWSRESHPMQRDQYGVWEITLPPVNGQPAIPHNTKIKVECKSLVHASPWYLTRISQISMTTPSGERIERLPAWIK